MKDLDAQLEIWIDDLQVGTGDVWALDNDDEAGFDEPPVERKQRL